MKTCAVISLREYQSKNIGKDFIAFDAGKMLWQNFGKYITVEFPNPQTEQNWRLTPQGYVGQIKTDELEIRLNPKVALDNLFGMLEHAYDLKLELGKQEIRLDSLNDIFERLAMILAKRICDRIQKGLYRAYVGTEKRLAFVRGRINIPKNIRQVWDPSIHCKFEQHTSDLEDNQILFLAMIAVLRTGICTKSKLPTIRKAFHGLKGAVSETSFDARHCINRDYNRLNFDYKPMHSICRFILEHTGPSHKAGDRDMLPFLINMNRLYERFVAMWLASNCPGDWTFGIHEALSFGIENTVRFDIDLVLRDRATRKAIAVLDTKYKAPESPATDDIFQVIAYAESLNCREAFLVYPKDLQNKLDITVGNIRVRSITFGIKDDLDQNGIEFLSELRKGVGHNEFRSTEELTTGPAITQQILEK